MEEIGSFWKVVVIGLSWIFLFCTKPSKFIRDFSVPPIFLILIPAIMDSHAKADDVKVASACTSTPLLLQSISLISTESPRILKRFPITHPPALARSRKQEMPMQHL